MSAPANFNGKRAVITTASVPQGPNGPLIPEIHQNAPHAKYVARKGEINAWDNPEFVAAVKATGRYGKAQDVIKNGEALDSQR